MKKKSLMIGFVILLLLLIFALSVFGANKKNSGAKVEIRLGLAMEADRLEFYQKAIDKFNKQNSNIVVKIENTPWTEYWQKLQTLTVSNTMPDVWNYVPGYGQEWLEKGRLLPLDRFIKQEPDVNLKDFAPGMLDYMRKDGKLYGLPYDMSGHILFYNKDLFDQAKVAYPTDQWTFDDLKKAAIKITNTVKQVNGGKVYGLGNYYMLGDWTTAGYLQSWGGDWVTKDLKVMVDAPGSIAALKFLQDLSKLNVITPPGEGGQGQEAGTLIAWINGRAAMVLDGPWSIPTYLKECKFNWDIVRVPAGPVKRSPSLLGGTFVIDAKTKHPKEAWKLLKYITGKEQLEEIVAKPGAGIPGRISAGASMIPIMQKAAKLISKNNVAFYPIQGAFSIFEVQQREFTQVWLGQKSAEDAAKSAADKAREVIKETYGK